MHVRNVLDAKGNVKVYTIPTTASLALFVKNACEMHVGALLVTDETGKIAGIVTERDVLYQCNAGANFDTVALGDVMTKELIVVSPEDDINVAMDIMIRKRIRHLPVMSGDKVEGIITIRDLIYAMRKADAEELRRLVEYLQGKIPVMG